MLVITIKIAITMKTIKQWPEEYLAWSGSFDDLVSTSAEVLADICPEAGAPTTSLVRYYQQQGAVGRGERKGRVASFSFPELAQVVAAKQMVTNQVPLAIAKELMKSSVDNIYLNETSVGEIQRSYAQTPAAAASLVMHASEAKVGNPAEQLVAKLMKQNANPPIAASGPLARAIHQVAPASLPMAASIGATNRHVPPGGTIRYSLAHGVNVEIPADHPDRRSQAQALRDFADQLDPHPPRRTP